MQLFSNEANKKMQLLLLSSLALIYAPNTIYQILYILNSLIVKTLTKSETINFYLKSFIELIAYLFVAIKKKWKHEGRNRKCLVK